MREIKFRGWNLNTKTMIVPGNIANPVPEVLGEHTGTIYMQAIGFQDKFGQEIYEGDNVLVIDEHGNDDSGPVWYVPERMAYCIVWHNGESSYSLSDTKQDEITIRGNIYENPDLSE